MRTPSDPNIMTLAQVAEWLGLSTKTVNALALDKKIPGRKIGKEWRFHKPTLEQFIAGNRRAA